MEKSSTKNVWKMKMLMPIHTLYRGITILEILNNIRDTIPPLGMKYLNMALMQTYQ